MKNVLVVLILLLTYFNVFSQEKIIQLSKKRKKIFLDNGFVGLSTSKEIIPYTRNVRTDSRIISISDSSIIILQPLKTKDTIIDRGDFEQIASALYPNYRFVKNFRRQGKKYSQLVLIKEYRKQAFLFKDLTSLRYPPRGSETVGCIFCILVPPYWFVLRQRFVPKTYHLKEWNLSVQPRNILNLTRKEKRRIN